MTQRQMLLISVHSRKNANHSPWALIEAVGKQGKLKMLMKFRQYFHDSVEKKTLRKVISYQES